MIPEILSTFAAREPGKKFRAALVGGGVYRTAQAYRSVALIFAEGKPHSVARWDRRPSANLQEEAELLQNLSSLGVSVPNFQELVVIQGTPVLVETFTPGKSLQILCDRCLLSVEDGLEFAKVAFDDLKQKSARVSDAEALRGEFLELSLGLRKYELLSGAAAQACDIAFGVLQERLGARAEQTCLHGDFCFKNILRSNQGTTLIDFEFAQESHFAFVDWLRLYRYSSGLRLGEVMENDFPVSIADLFSSEQMIAAMLSIFEYHDLLIRLRVFPRPLHSGMIETSKLRLGVLFAEGVGQYFDAVEQSRPGDPEFNESDFSKEELQAEFTARREAETNLARFRARAETAALQLARRQEEVGELRQRIDEYQLQCADLQRRVERGVERDSELRRQIQDLQNILAHKEELLQSVIHSVSFRLGSKLTNVVRRMPGSSRVRNVLRS